MKGSVSTVEIVHACLKVYVLNIKSASVSYYTAYISNTYMYRYKYRYKSQINIYIYRGTFQVVLVVKGPPANVEYVRGTGSIPGLGRCPERSVSSHSVFMPGEFHEQRRVARLQSILSQSQT